MLKVPSSRRHKSSVGKLSLVSFADTVLILIFFVFLSATLFNVQEIGSSSSAAKRTGSLALKLVISKDEITLHRGTPSHIVHTFKRESNFGQYSSQELSAKLSDIKKDYPDEDTITLEPVGDLTYAEIVEVMDSVRSSLFDKIVFGNLLNS